jgi:hypothetical protein
LPDPDDDARWISWHREIADAGEPFCTPEIYFNFAPHDGGTAEVTLRSGGDSVVKSIRSDRR